MQALTISSYTVTTALGCGNQANFDSLQQQESGLIANNFLETDLNTWIGRVDALEEKILPHGFENYQSRNNQLAYLTLQQDGFSDAVEQAKKIYGADKIGVFLGTSTSGILSTELAYAELQNGQFSKPDLLHFREQHNSFSLAEFVQSLFNLCGPAQVVSTACSSSAKVFAAASRYIELGLCEAAIVGGVDSLCLTTLYGFNSLELLSDEICRPADKNRKGLSIGEAGAFALLEKDTKESKLPPVYLLGYGESSDAYHMSSPHPEGLGAIQAIQSAITMAKLSPEHIDYVNLHGTATQVNDQVEDKAIHAVFDCTTYCSSTKGWTGHTLGAAGAVEAIYSILCLQNNFLPGSLNTLQLDDSFKSHILLENQYQTLHTVLSNSFAFGGNNCSLIFADNKGCQA